MNIAFTYRIVINDVLPGPKRPGLVFLFSDNVSWKTIDGVSVTGLAGTHSGTHRVLRIENDQDPDRALAKDTVIWEYEATFVLNAVTYDGNKTLAPGQVTVRGVWYAKDEHPVDSAGQRVDKRRYAVTGGTGPYGRVRGQGFETVDSPPGTPEIKTLEIDL